jgi:hypothetical protein
MQDIIGKMNEAIAPERKSPEEAVEFIDELIAELEIVKDAIQIEERDRKR